jgi:hypothetical protein
VATNIRSADDFKHSGNIDDILLLGAAHDAGNNRRRAPTGSRRLEYRFQSLISISFENAKQPASPSGYIGNPIQALTGIQIVCRTRRACRDRTALLSPGLRFAGKRFS